MLGGIHFLSNRLLRTCLSAVAYGSGKSVCVRHGVCVFLNEFFWVCTHLRRYISYSKPLCECACNQNFTFLMFSSRRKNPGLQRALTKVHRVIKWDDTCCSLALRFKVAASHEMIIFKIQVKMEPRCLLKHIKDQHSSFQQATCRREAPTGSEEKDDFFSEAYSATVCEKHVGLFHRSWTFSCCFVPKVWHTFAYITDFFSLLLAFI